MKNAVLAAMLVSLPLSAQDRRMAITVDDVPVSGPRWTGNDLSVVQRVNREMIRAFVAHGVPAVGFVNEQRLGNGPDRSDRIAVLQAWLDAGLELGNHTFSHPDLNDTPLEEYQADVLRGEEVSRPLSRAAGRPYRYFRFPFTHTGTTVETRDAFRAFLTSHDYVHAPFTIENVDYAFNVLVADAQRRRDAQAESRALDAYLAHTDSMVRYFESLSVDTFGREIPQILLIHVNLVNAAVMERMLTALEDRGYRFVSVEEALADPAYRTRDEFVGEYGPSWLHRFRIALGKPRRMDEPDPPQWVMDRYYRIIGNR